MASGGHNSDAGTASAPAQAGFQQGMHLAAANMFASLPAKLGRANTLG
jgi:hypothetical protein